MRKLLRKGVGRLLLIVALAVSSSVLTATPAHADHNNHGRYSDYFVDGGDVLTDDWGDHYAELGYSLCYGCLSNDTDLVVLWQTILFAEGFLSEDSITGYFGPLTHDATQAWQVRYRLLADGKVNDATWKRADEGLRWLSSTSSYLEYNATGSGYVTLIRGSESYNHDDGAYQLVEAWNGYTYLSCWSSYHVIYFAVESIECF